MPHSTMLDQLLPAPTTINGAFTDQHWPSWFVSSSCQACQTIKESLNIRKPKNVKMLVCLPEHHITTMAAYSTALIQSTGRSRLQSPIIAGTATATAMMVGIIAGVVLAGIQLEDAAVTAATVSIIGTIAVYLSSGLI